MDCKQEVRQLLKECKAKLTSFGKVFILEDHINDLLKSFTVILTSSLLERETELKTFQSQFEEKHGTAARVSLCQYFVFSLFCANVERINQQKLPHEIGEYIREDFFRAVKIAKQGKVKLLTVENPIFYSYLEVLAFVRFPVGNQSVVLAGFSRSLIRHQSPLKIFSLILSIYTCGGNYPLYEQHYNPHRLREFNPKGWRKVMRLGAELLQTRPEIKGIFGSAWFYDPALKAISPELSYLRELVLETGGEVFFAGRTTQDKKNAFAMSKARKNAFKEGLYDPASYLALIPRKALLKHFHMY